MPDRYGEIADLDDDDNAHMAPHAVAHCELCDDEGYRPSGVVCDHIDRTDIARRGVQACRDALAKDKPA